MSRRLVASLAALCALAGCASNPVYTAHRRGFPRDVMVEKVASEPELRVHVERRGEAVRLRVGTLQHVELTRRVRHGDWRFDARGSVGGEVGEMIAGIYMAIIGGPLCLALADFDYQSPEYEVDFHDPGQFFFLDPTRTVWGTLSIDAQPVEDEGRFLGPETRRAYDVRLPLEGQRVAFRLLDAGRRPTAEGEGVSDVLGRVPLPAPGPLDVAVEVRVGERTVVLALPPAAPATQASAEVEPGLEAVEPAAEPEGGDGGAVESAPGEAVEGETEPPDQAPGTPVAPPPV